MNEPLLCRPAGHQTWNGTPAVLKARTLEQVALQSLGTSLIEIGALRGTDKNRDHDPLEKGIGVTQIFNRAEFRVLTALDIERDRTPEDIAPDPRRCSHGFLLTRIWQIDDFEIRCPGRRNQNIVVHGGMVKDERRAGFRDLSNDFDRVGHISDASRIGFGSYQRSLVGEDRARKPSVPFLDERLNTAVPIVRKDQIGTTPFGYLIWLAARRDRDFVSGLALENGEEVLEQTARFGSANGRNADQSGARGSRGIVRLPATTATPTAVTPTAATPGSVPEARTATRRSWLRRLVGETILSP